MNTISTEAPNPLSPEAQARISAAADHIVSMGEKPSQTSVRTHLGGGSMRDISRGLAIWNSGRVGIEQDNQKNVLEAETHTRQILDLFSSQACEITRLNSVVKIANDERDAAIVAAEDAKNQAQEAISRSESILKSGCVMERKIMSLTKMLKLNQENNRKWQIKIEARIAQGSRPRP